MKTETQHKPGYKKTKLGWIPEEWRIARLGDFVMIKSGDSPSNYNLCDTGNTPYIKVEDLNNCNKYQKKSRFYSNDEKNKIPIESIIFPKRGAAILNNKVRITAYEIFMDSNMMAIYTKGKCIDCEFLYYKIIKEKLAKIADTSTIPQINNKHILPYKISLPSIPEQKKIAEILSCWDEAIESTQNLIEKLQLRKKGLTQQLLTGKKRLPGFSEEWKKTRISKIADEYSVKNKEDKKIEVLSCTKYDGLVPSLQYFGRKVFGDDLTKYKIVPFGYFAYATNHIEEGSIGYQNLMEKGLVSPMYTVFKSNDSIDDKFLFKLLKTDKMIYQYQSNMSGSIARRGGLRWTTFKSIEILIPPLKEQTAIAQILTKADEEIKQTQNYLEKLQQQKKGLMQQLLTGQKRVKLS